MHAISLFPLYSWSELTIPYYWAIHTNLGKCRVYLLRLPRGQRIPRAYELEGKWSCNEINTFNMYLGRSLGSQVLLLSLHRGHTFRVIMSGTRISWLNSIYLSRHVAIPIKDMKYRVDETMVHNSFFSFVLQRGCLLLFDEESIITLVVFMASVFLFIYYPS
ncbi:hypothetical protein F4809DRAFT_615955, partial [Biscogniauxia mediterranea]